jgi:hypothetical protein
MMLSPQQSPDENSQGRPHNKTLRIKKMPKKAAMFKSKRMYQSIKTV